MTDTLASYQVAYREMLTSIEHRRSKNLRPKTHMSQRDNGSATDPICVLRHHRALPAASAHVVGI